MRRLAPGGIAFCVMAGFVLARFNSEIAPASHLIRPLVAVCCLSMIIGALSLAAGRRAVVVAAGLGALLIAPVPWGILLAALLATVLLFERMLSKEWSMNQVVFAIALVFFASGAVPVLPRVTAEAHASEQPPTDFPPTFIILLDAYPRIDTLRELGLDNSSFIGELEQRGFDHYPTAHSDYVWTFDVLSAMLGDEIANDAAIAVQRRVRRGWELPPGWVTISPPAGRVAIPNVKDISRGGTSWFELGLLGDSPIGRLPPAADWMMDQLRERLANDIATIGATDHKWVFAHLISPHVPFLYRTDGSPIPGPECWPACSPTHPGTLDIDGLAGTLDYLNKELIEAVDRILTRFPGATIVLFSDHGGRYSFDDPAEWHHSFLAARTSEPFVFGNDPRPEQILHTLGWR